MHEHAICPPITVNSQHHLALVICMIKMGPLGTIEAPDGKRTAGIFQCFRPGKYIFGDKFSILHLKNSVKPEGIERTYGNGSKLVCKMLPQPQKGPGGLTIRHNPKLLIRYGGTG